MRLRLAFLLMLIAFPVLAHTSMSGFKYPQACCNGTEMGGDCQMIDAEAVVENSDGSYTIKASGEIFLPPDNQSPNNPDGNFQFTNGIAHRVGGHAKWSPDGMFHRCFHDIKNPADGSYCLWVPQPGV